MWFIRPLPLVHGVRCWHRLRWIRRLAVLARRERPRVLLLLILILMLVLVVARIPIRVLPTRRSIACCCDPVPMDTGMTHPRPPCVPGMVVLLWVVGNNRHESSSNGNSSSNRNNKSKSKSKNNNNINNRSHRNNKTNHSNHRNPPNPSHKHPTKPQHPTIQHPHPHKTNPTPSSTQPPHTIEQDYGETCIPTGMDPENGPITLDPPPPPPPPPTTTTTTQTPDNNHNSLDKPTSHTNPYPPPPPPTTTPTTNSTMDPPSHTVCPSPTIPLTHPRVRFEAPWIILIRVDRRRGMGLVVVR